MARILLLIISVAITLCAGVPRWENGNGGGMNGRNMMKMMMMTNMMNKVMPNPGPTYPMPNPGPSYPTPMKPS